jgi:hypothetical protein
MKRFKNTEPSLLFRQTISDDGTLYFQSEASKLRPGSRTPALNDDFVAVPRDEGNRKQHVLLVDIVRRFPPDLHSHLVLRDEGIVSLPRFAFQNVIGNKKIAMNWFLCF